MPRVMERVKSTRGSEYVCSFCNKPIEPGESFFYWTFRYGGTRRQHAHHGRPKRSQLTQSRMGEVYASVESFEALMSDGGWVRDDVVAAIEEMTSVVEEIHEAYTDAAEHFGGQGSNQERAEELESLLDSLQQADVPDEPEPEQEERDCPTCKGTGSVSYQPRPEVAAIVSRCEDCDGEGHRTSEEPSEEQMQEWRTEVEDVVNDILGNAP